MEVMKGFKKTAAGIIPLDWEIKELNQISEKIMVGIASAATHAYQKRGGVIMFRNQNIRNGCLDDNDVLNISNEYEQLFKNKRLKAGDLLTARTGYPGTTCLVPSKYQGAQSFTTLITRPKVQEIQSDYLCYYINSESGQNFFKTNQIGGGQKNVNAGTLKLMPIPIPPTKTEQTAIATALSDTDALITSLEKLIAKKRNIKQGAMQRLLKPKEGWHRRELGEICFPSKNRINPVTSNENYRCVELEHLSQGTGQLLGYALSKNLKSQKTLFHEGDVLFGKLRPYLRKFLLAEFTGVCTTEIWVLKPQKDISNRFIFHLIQTDKIIEAANLSTGTKMPRAEWKTVAATKVHIPKNCEEQDEIADALSDLDSEICALQSKLGKVRAMKSGMMQSLLTGKIRLNH